MALENCEKCLKLSPLNYKALARKAWALHDLVKDGAVELKGAAFAAAALAVHVNQSNFQHINEMFLGLSYKVLNKSSFDIAKLLFDSPPRMTLLLEEGEHRIDVGWLTDDLQIVGLGAGVIINSNAFVILSGRCYFENISFRDGRGVNCCTDAVVSLYKCNISGGDPTCKDFPECNGGSGCLGEPRGQIRCNRQNKFGKPGMSGCDGSPGLQVKDTGFVDSCTIYNCGGGGVICAGNKTKLHIRNSEVYGNAQAGLEARQGGHLVATNNRIYSNRTQGVLIGPNASSRQFTQNNIFENAKERIHVWSTPQKIVFEENDVYHNRAFGFSRENSNTVVLKNRVFENGFYGILANSRTTAMVNDNDIFANKCGGIYIGMNYSGRVTIESNTIRDHCGPSLLYSDEQAPTEIRRNGNADNRHYVLPEGETTIYSKIPFISNNKEINNKEGIFHPQQLVKNLCQNECAFCHSTEPSCKKCGQCRFVGYCSKDCQRKHWRKHKPLCSAVSSRYSVTVKRIYTDDVGQDDNITYQFGKSPKPSPGSNKRFVVKIQTHSLHCHPLQLLTVYDQSKHVDCSIQSPKIFYFVMECGVLGAPNLFTSKKAFFWATFANDGDDLKISLDELAPYQDW